VSGTAASTLITAHSDPLSKSFLDSQDIDMTLLQESKADNH